MSVQSGSQSVVGTLSSNAQALDHVRFLGFTIETEPAMWMAGVGNEFAHNDVQGHYVATTDNHDGLRIEHAAEFRVHHNAIHGVRGESQNSAGIKLYDTNDGIIEDKYFYDNTTGVFDKDSGIDNTYRRNYITGNDAQRYGNNQDQISTVFIHDNCSTARSSSTISWPTRRSTTTWCVASSSAAPGRAK